jgi:hypothetical protein
LAAASTLLTVAAAVTILCDLGVLDMRWTNLAMGLNCAFHFAALYIT